MYSVIIPSNRSMQQILPTLFALSIQTILADKIYIIIDRKISKEDMEKYKNLLFQELGDFSKKILLISSIDTSFQVGLGVSYVRNYGFSLVDSPLVLSVDDDNILDVDFLERLINTRKTIKKSTNRSAVLIPTEQRKGITRSRGYRGFSYFIGIQKAFRMNIFSQKKAQVFAGETVFPIKFASSNCIFGPTQIFQQIPLDEHMAFVYEDMDWTQRITQAGYPMYVLKDLFVDHQMREKTPLEMTYLSSPSQAYQKARNRIIMVKNTASWDDKLIYFLFGLWSHTLFLCQKILRFASRKERKELCHSVWKGTRDGIRGKY
ncbi:MAG: hypothetical protein GXP45_07460 [bacterium]|nr:hypothetical protein [bacterium]